MLTRHFGYFATLFDASSPWRDSQCTTHRLESLDPSTVEGILRYAQMDRNSDSVMDIWDNWMLETSHDDAVQELQCTIDYLQMVLPASYSHSERMLHLGNLMAMQNECLKQGYIMMEPQRVVSLPTGKKKRVARFWVCCFLCLELFPDVGTPMDQQELTERLAQFTEGMAEAVELRREFIEAGLLEREGDGSAYWRPIYSANMLEKWTRGGARRVI